MTNWQALDDELCAWAEEGRRAGLWWRDDDAAKDSPALRQLLDLAGGDAPPVVIAVVPATLSDAAAERISAGAGQSHYWVVQHGYAHANHASDNERRAPQRISKLLWLNFDTVLAIVWICSFDICRVK